MRDELSDWTRAHGLRTHSMAEVGRCGFEALLQRAIEEALDGPEHLFLSLDIDVLDAAFVPGAEPPSLTDRELLPAIRRICHETPVVGMDLVARASAADTGCTGVRIVRVDSQFYNADVVAACRRAGARFSLTVRMNPHLAAAITTMTDDDWTPIHYSEACETGSAAGAGELPAPAGSLLALALGPGPPRTSAIGRWPSYTISSGSAGTAAARSCCRCPWPRTVTRSRCRTSEWRSTSTVTSTAHATGGPVPVKFLR